MDEAKGEAQTEAAELEALRRGDERAFVRLVERHQPMLRRVVRLYVSNPGLAEEVIQDTWLGVVRGLFAFQGRSSLKTWILRILVNRARTRGAREAKAPASTTPPELLEDAPDAPRDGTPSPERRLLLQEVHQRTQAAIASLPRQQRLVLVLRDVEGCDSKEVCNVLGLTETNERVLLHRARARVREALEPYLEGRARP